MTVATRGLCPLNLNICSLPRFLLGKTASICLVKLIIVTPRACGGVSCAVGGVIGHSKLRGKCSREMQPEESLLDGVKCVAFDYSVKCQDTSATAHKNSSTLLQKSRAAAGWRLAGQKERNKQRYDTDCPLRASSSSTVHSPTLIGPQHCLKTQLSGDASWRDPCLNLWRWEHFCFPIIYLGIRINFDSEKAG